MKSQDTRFTIIIATTMLLVCAYQLYWLIGQYKDLETRFERDINEVLRSADFEELAHRVEEISRMDFQGNVEVNMGYDHEDGRLRTRSQVKEEPLEDTREQKGIQTTVNASSFGNTLKTPEDLTNIGLSMQRGIHLSLDAIMDVDIPYLDRIITEKLDSLGLSGEHELLYIKTSDEAAGSGGVRTDTIARSGGLTTSDANTFSIKVSEETEYRMVIPNWHLAVLKKMLPVILFSLLTLTLLVVTFLYLVRTMRRQREMEEIKTDFTNNITHELKTPIAVAYAANDALLNYGAESNTPRMNRYLQVCQEQLRLLDRLVEQILSVSKERKKAVLLNMEVIDVAELLLTITNTFRFKYPDAGFTASVAQGMTVRSDRMHLSNIIGNLIDNAVKYTKGKAEVRLNAYADEKGNGVIEVSDNGIGISPDQQRYIFDRFYRVPHGNVHDVKGYGLGLFYVKSMTERLEGDVSVRSALGKGSTFILTFRQNDTYGKNQDIIG